MTKKLFLFVCAVCAALGLRAEDIVVDHTGKGDFRTIQEAVNSVRDFRPEGRVEILIRKGVYREKLSIPTEKCTITLRGEDRDQTIISWGDYASLDNMGTFRTRTLFIGGNDIILEDLTVENTAGEVGQAVALHVEGDRIVFRNCRFLGNQDTIYAGREGARQYFADCYIEGTTDFIFGPSTAWFERCTIHCKRNSFITAASTPQAQPYGFIFNNCTVTAAEGITSVWLGRPWRGYAMTLFMRCRLPGAINPAGWENWRNPDNERTARYGEYRNTGPGADTTARVRWSRQWSDTEVRQFETARDTSFTLWSAWEKEVKTRPGLALAEADPFTEINTAMNVVYSTITDRLVGVRELHMNIYMPVGPTRLVDRQQVPAKARPALLMVHGGGWNSGDRTMEAPLARRLADRGFVVATVEYRLTPEAPYPAAVHDLKDAVRWLRANAARYGVDPERIAIAGFSAGGQLANLVGATNGRGEYEVRRENVLVSSDVQAVINGDGLSDFITPETVDRARQARERCLKMPVDALWLGGTYEERPEVWAAASPLRQTGANSAPVCFINSAVERFHAGRDAQVDLLTDLGIHAEVHTLPDTPHTFWLFAPWVDETAGVMAEFLDKVLR